MNETLQVSILFLTGDLLIIICCVIVMIDYRRFFRDDKKQEKNKNKGERPKPPKGGNIAQNK